ncbi:MAG: cell division protein FtsZ [Bacteroidia bacterium]|nr:cell division protein FtsZ [Bacteroidia bacterium]
MLQFDLPQNNGTSSIIKVIGVGGGGSNAVNHMFKQGIKGVDFVVCNTDSQALETSPVERKIQLGSSLTEGRGAGAKPEVGRNAALENIEDIKKILGDNTKMVFITAGMGGGTGTGAAPVIAATAKEMGILTVGIITIPFHFEGPKRKTYADSGLEELSRTVDTLLVISNEKVRLLFGNLKMSEAFAKADDILTTAAKSIAELITVSGYINVDFEDVKTVMTNSGVAIMGSGKASGANRASDAVRNALESPLLNDNHITGASNILLFISSGSEEITMDEVSEITDYITQQAGTNTDIIWGNGIDETLGDNILVTVIATGFTKNSELINSVAAKKPEIIKYNLGAEKTNLNSLSSVSQPTTTTATKVEIVKSEESEVSTSLSNEITETVIGTIEVKEVTNTVEETINELETTDDFNFSLKTTDSNPTAIESGDKIVYSLTDEKPQVTPTSSNEVDEKMRIHKERVERLKAFNFQHFNQRGPKGIDDYEKEPAYKRKNMNLENVPHSSENVQGKMSLGVDENNQATFGQNNSFLHGSVD